MLQEDGARSLRVCSPEKNLIQRRSPSLLKSFCRVTHRQRRSPDFSSPCEAEAKPPPNSPQCSTSCSLTALRFLSTSHNAHLQSMWWEPVVTDRTRSTCRLWLQLSLPAQVLRCANTAIDRPRRRAEPPMCSKNLASTSALLLTPWLDVSQKPGSVSALRQHFIQPFVSPARHDARLASQQRLTSSAQWPTRVECSGR